MSTNKTATTLFHLDNKQANKVLKIKIENKMLPNESYRKDAGVTLNRTLSHKKHTKNIAQKLEKLSSNNYGTHQTILDTFALAFC